jgi:hypothetical protein
MKGNVKRHIRVVHFSLRSVSPFTIPCSTLS